jgi:hypothetical protein
MWVTFQKSILLGSCEYSVVRDDVKTLAVSVSMMAGCL